MNWLRAGALIAALGVVLGAFGAHGLESIANDEQLGWWHTGNLFHLLTVPALLVLGVAARTRAPIRQRSGWLLAGGTLLFSGTLYAMALGAPRWFGAITPIGGLLLILGWLLLAVDSNRAPIE